MSFVSQSRIPHHVAVVMDGNGRWAERQGLPRIAGHRAGAEAVRRTVEAAAECAVPVLTLYAFSSDNWHRPQSEVDALMSLFAEFLQRESAQCARRRIRLNVVGRRDRISAALRKAIEEAEAATAAGTMLLRIAVDYSARDSIVRAAALHPGGDLCRERFSGLIAAADSSLAPVPEVDLLIRTGGERRLSDFLLWELAYAELYFTEVMWPEFDGRAFRGALEEFGRRQRRFGRIPA
jgi:undecaprenyl diphosphate synthase